MFVYKIGRDGYGGVWDRLVGLCEWCKNKRDWKIVVMLKVVM